VQASKQTLKPPADWAMRLKVTTAHTARCTNVTPNHIAHCAQLIT